MTKYLRSRTFWFSFLLSFIAFFILVAGIYLFNRQSDITSSMQASRIENEKSIEEISSYLNNILKDMIFLTERIRSTSWVSKISVELDIFDEEFNYKRRQEISADFLFNTGQNNYLSRIFIIYPYKDICIGGGIWANSNDYFGVIGIHNDKKPVLKESIRTVSKPTLINPEITNEKLLIIFPVENITNSRVYLCVFLNKENIASTIGNMTSGGITGVRIFDNNFSDPLLVHGVCEKNDIIRIYQHEALHINWTYEYYIDDWITTVIYTESQRNFPEYLFIVTGVCILAAFILSIFLYRPMANLMARLFTVDRSYNFNDYNAIGYHINVITERYNQSRRIILLNQLLSGLFIYDELNLKEQLIPFCENGYHKVFLCEDLFNSTIKQRNELYITIEDLFKKHDIPCAVVENIDTTLIVITAFSDELSARQFDFSFFYDMFNEQYAVYTGVEAPGLIGVSISYHSAREKRSYILGLNQPKYYLPLDWEIQLLNMLLLGNIEVVKNIIVKIQFENERRYIDGQMPESDYKLLIKILIDNVRRVIKEKNMIEINFMETIYFLYTIKPLNNTWDQLINFCETICSNFKNEVNTGQSIINYIESHYQNCDLSLTVLEDVFGLSSNTILKFIKQNKGLTFHVYMTHLRINHAQELLNGNLKISQIAKMVGYDNEYSFRRAFQRFTGKKIQDYKNHNHENL